MNTQKQTTESTPVELSLEQLAEVSGGTPRGGWFTDPGDSPTLDSAVAKTSAAVSSDAS